MNDLVVFTGFGRVLLEALLALLPLLVFFFVFQYLYLDLPRDYVLKILKGIAISFLGLALFLQGVHVGFMPVGREMGIILGGAPHRWILIPLGFVLGFVATYAEPAVRVLSSQVEHVSGGYLRKRVIIYTLSLGVAFFVALGMVRILLGIPFYYIIIPGYLLVLILLKFSNPDFVAVAFDSGGVATGPMTVTFIMSMAVGVATVIEERSAIADGFGLIALVALAPIVAVMILGMLYGKKEEEVQ